MTETSIDQWRPVDFRRESARITESNETDPECICGAILLASLREGASFTKLSRATGYSRDCIRPYFNNLVDSQIFLHNGVDGAGWFDDDVGIVEFHMAVLCGLGLVERTA